MTGNTVIESAPITALDSFQDYDVLTSLVLLTRSSPILTHFSKPKKNLRNRYTTLNTGS